MSSQECVKDTPHGQVSPGVKVTWPSHVCPPDVGCGREEDRRMERKRKEREEKKKEKERKEKGNTRTVSWST